MLRTIAGYSGRKIELWPASTRKSANRTCERWKGEKVSSRVLLYPATTAPASKFSAHFQCPTVHSFSEL